MSRAVVFAYHDIGVRCLKTLRARGLEITLVVTHSDQPGEQIWFDSVRDAARDYRIPVITPEDPNTAEVLARVRAARPDFLFSFYYRRMLGAPLLASAARGAYNMHGSLLPKYRGRVPINWAILHGETETGATLHAMNEKPDDGAIVDQFAVPILPDDSAREVFDKVALAAELVLWRSLPALLDGSARLRPQQPIPGQYFGARKPEDGRIPAAIGARALHDFVRALTHPYPGAFADIDAGRLTLWRTLPDDAGEDAGPGARGATACAGPDRPGAGEAPLLGARGDELSITCADGRRLRVLQASLDGAPLDAGAFRVAFGDTTIRLGP